ncbi:MAG: endonuclease III [Phycisphaerae bacterium]|nr:endonuclease III [Phycisphaerae bacterium]
MPRESQTTRCQRTGKIFRSLKSYFPNAHCELVHSNPLELLVATIMSAQCTDKRVNIVTQDLFRKYRTAEDYAGVPQETLEQDIRSTGFYRNKSKNIRGAAAMIIKDFGGKIPQTMAELLLLPGVARKTANVVLSNAFGKNEGVVVDTHVKRISARLGLTKQTTPEKIEIDLMDLVPQKDWGLFGHLIVFLGRSHCNARKPDCQACPLSAKKLCPSANTFD